MTSAITGAPFEILSLFLLVVATVFALVATVWLSSGSVLGAVRTRFVLGVPWGTVVVVLVVVAVYLGIQDAWGQLTEPLVTPFRAWSYWYPLGMVTAAFSHADKGHITQNLLATVVFAPIAEYVWCHYPTRRGSQSFSTWVTNPFGRILVFVGAVLAVGLLTSLFVPGYVIGFSGVLFAFAGFVLLTRPITALVAYVGIRVVRLGYYSVVEPILTSSAGPEYASPWWAGVAVQGHVFGLLVGVLFASVLLRRRGETPDVRRVWIAALLLGVAQSLYALYVPVGSETFVLFRAAGMAAVLLLATVIAAAIADPDRQLLSDRIDLPVRVAAGALLVCVVGAIGLAAVPANVADVEPGEDLDRDLTVRDYTVGYAEDVEQGYVSAVELPFVSDPMGANVSGVVVASDRRNAWEVRVSAGRLAFDGRRTISVGGLGWRERIVANRTTWSVVNGDETYKVFLGQEGEPQRLVHRADPARVSGTYAGRNVSIAPTASGYEIVVRGNGTRVGRTAVPAPGGFAVADELGFERVEDELYVLHGKTRVQIASYRTGRPSS